MHVCSYVVLDYLDVANVIVNYSAASIPLETMWTDIGEMDRSLCVAAQLTLRRLHGQTSHFHCGP